MKKEKNVIVCISMPERVAKRLGEIARKRMTSVSAIVRAAIMVELKP